MNCLCVDWLVYWFPFAFIFCKVMKMEQSSSKKRHKNGVKDPEYQEKSHLLLCVYYMCSNGLANNNFFFQGVYLAGIVAVCFEVKLRLRWGEYRCCLAAVKKMWKKKSNVQLEPEVALTNKIPPPKIVSCNFKPLESTVMGDTLKGWRWSTVLKSVSVGSFLSCSIPLSPIMRYLVLFKHTHMHAETCWHTHLSFYTQAHWLYNSHSLHTHTHIYRHTHIHSCQPVSLYTL